MDTKELECCCESKIVTENYVNIVMGIGLHKEDDIYAQMFSLIK